MDWRHVIVVNLGKLIKEIYTEGEVIIYLLLKGQHILFSTM